MLKTLLQGLTDLVFPYNCLLCRGSLFVNGRGLPTDEKRDILCNRCVGTIEPNRPPFCSKCSRPVLDCDSPLCRDCLKTELHFDQAWGACLYTGAVRRLIHLFKYNHKTSLRKPLVDMIFSFLDDYKIPLQSFEAIVPLPLHPARMRERGYNQAQLLSQPIAARLGTDHITDNLIRMRPTQNQALLGKKDRWTNIRGAFKIKNVKPFSKKSVLLVDDLLTTGITASEAAHVLKEAGAARVGVVTLAIAL